MHAVFDNAPFENRVRLTLERDPTTLMRALELFAMRGALPIWIQFEADARRDSLAVLRLSAVLGRHDWDVLCKRAATLVGVLDIANDSPDAERLLAPSKP